MGYYVYIVRCAGGSLYTGIAADWKRRLREHEKCGSRSAKYTRSRPVEALEALWEAESRTAAARMEYRIKRLSAAEKRRLAAAPAQWRQLLPELEREALRAVTEETLPRPLNPARGPNKQAERR